MAITLPNTSRSAALNLTTDLAQAGATFNDATRLLDGGLWTTPTDGNQLPYLSEFNADIHSVLNDITADLANPAGVTINGQAYTLTAADTAVLQQVQGQLQTLLNEAPLSAGSSAAATQAQELIHITQTSILNEINGDTGLAKVLDANSYASGTGANNVGFEALPVGSDSAAAITAATAQGATLGQIGSVYNAAADLAVGGLNSANMPEFAADMQAVATGIQNILNNPTQLAAIEKGETATSAALTTVHLDTVLNQVNLQLNRLDGEVTSNPGVGARAANDNLLDIIDIVQNDAALNTSAGGNGTPGTVGGFAEMPAYLNGAGGVNAHGGTITQYQDNQASTNFWAQFIAGANTIQGQLDAVAAGQNTTPAAINALVTEIQNYQQFGASFDASQGGIFGARFDNELLSGTLLADTNNAVHGLQGIANGDTGAALAADQAQIQAAGIGFVADANDVSGNNIPEGGGSYVGTSFTVSGATSVAGLAQGTNTPGPVANGATGLTATGTTTTSGTTTTGAGTGTGTTGTDHTGTTTSSGTTTTGTGTTGTGTTGTSHTGTTTSSGTTTTGTGTTSTGTTGTGHTGTTTSSGTTTTGTGTAGNGTATSHLLTDLNAFFHGSGNAQTILSDLTALAGGQNGAQNSLATLLADLEQAAGGTGAAAAGGAGAGANGGAGDPGGHSGGHMWHHM
jgi:trimeric autotransporter adhesin